MTTGAPPPVPADRDAIERGASLLRNGGLVAFPTETVYGLGADATNDMAVAAVFEAKGRPQFNPLIIHVSDIGMAERHVVFTDLGRRLAAAHWPGGLTLVLQRQAASPVSRLAGAGLESLAVRWPSHRVAQQLIAAAARPVAAPSANRSGGVSPTIAQHVRRSLGAAVSLILDGGPCPLGIESTVVDARRERPVILRPGAVTADEIAAIAEPADPGNDGGDVGGGQPPSPGMQARHYAPGRPLRLDAQGAEPGESLLGFGPEAPAGAMNLSPRGDLREAAANLFAMLHVLDMEADGPIAVMPVPEAGLGQAINDRLRRAATPLREPPDMPGYTDE